MANGIKDLAPRVRCARGVAWGKAAGRLPSGHITLPCKLRERVNRPRTLRNVTASIEAV